MRPSLLSALAAAWVMGGVAAEPAAPPPDDCGAVAVRHLARLLAPDAATPPPPAAAAQRSLAEVVDLLAAAGIAAEAVKGTLDELAGQGRPCVLHLTRPDHFAVLAASSADRQQFGLLDEPAARLTWVARADLAPRCDGYAAMPSRPRAPSGPVAAWDGTLRQLELPALGSTASFEFPISNAGRAALKLELAAKDCSCIQAEVPATVAPGQRAVLRLSYRTDNIGANRHVTVIRSNDPSLPLQHLLANAVVTGGIELKPRQLSVRTTYGAAWQQSLQVTTPAGVTVRAVEVEPALAEATVVGQTVGEGVRHTEMRLRGEPGTPSGQHAARVRLAFAPAALPPVELPLILAVQPAFEVLPAALFLGRVPGIGYATVRLVTHDGSTPRVAEVTCDDRRVELGERVQLLHAVQIPLTVRPEAGALLDTVLCVRLLEPEPRELTVTLTAMSYPR